MLGMIVFKTIAKPCCEPLCHRHIPWRTAWGSWTSAVGAGQAQCREARVAFFSSAKASDTGVIRTGGCEFAKSELLHTCTANLSEIFIFSILYC